MHQNDKNDTVYIPSSLRASASCDLRSYASQSCLQTKPLTACTALWCELRARLGSSRLASPHLLSQTHILSSPFAGTLFEARVARTIFVCVSRVENIFCFLAWLFFHIHRSSFWPSHASVFVCSLGSPIVHKGRCIQVSPFFPFLSATIPLTQRTSTVAS